MNVQHGMSCSMPLKGCCIEACSKEVDGAVGYFQRCKDLQEVSYAGSVLIALGEAIRKTAMVDLSSIGQCIPLRHCF